jgi:hypothetical protein
MWNLPWLSCDSHKSTGSSKFNVSMVSVNPEIKCFYSTESVKYRNQFYKEIVIVLCSARKGEIQMKNLLIIVFCKINNKKFEEKGNVQKTFTMVFFHFVAFKHYISLFTSITFRCHITMWAFARFGHFSCGRPRLEFSKLEEKKKMTMIQIRKWSKKAWCHEKRGVTWEEIIGKQTKLWSRRN